MKRVLSRLAVGVALTVGTVAGATATTQAASPPAVEAIRPQHGPHQNGCTMSPDSGPHFNFHNACDWHDLCYHYAYYGRHEVGRLGCDNGFLSRMRNSCYNRYPNWYQVPLRNLCYGTANVYYSAVRSAGWAFFY